MSESRVRERLTTRVSLLPKYIPSTRIAQFKATVATAREANGCAYRAILCSWYLTMGSHHRGSAACCSAIPALAFQIARLAGRIVTINNQNDGIVGIKAGKRGGLAPLDRALEPGDSDRLRL